MDFNINLDGLDFSNFDITDFASSLDFNLEDDILNASLSGRSATPYYSDHEHSNAPLQEQEWFKPKYKNILNDFFEGQDQSIGAYNTADNARRALWGDAQKALNSGVDPDKVFNALRAAGNKSEAKLIEENLTNKRKLAGGKIGSTGKLESLVVDSAREKLNTFNSNLSSTLQSNPDSFNSQFDALPTNGKLSFLHHQYKQGDLPKDKYEEAYIATVNSAYDPEARNTPVFVEVDGKVYLNPSPWKTNKTADELLEPDFYNVDEWSPAGGSENAIGVRITGERTKDFDPSGFNKFLQDFSVFRAPLALVTAGASEAFISAAAGLSGETLQTSDWLNLAAAGYDLANTPETVPTEPDIFDSIDAGVATIDLDGVPLDITAGGSVFDSFDEDEQPEIEIIETAPPQVETEQELPDAPEAEQEPIEADPIEEVITQPTLPEVVEEVEEVEEVEAGGGGEPAPEPTAPTESTDPTAPTEPVEETIDAGDPSEIGAVFTDDRGVVWTNRGPNPLNPDVNVWTTYDPDEQTIADFIEAGFDYTEGEGISVGSTIGQVPQSPSTGTEEEDTTETEEEDSAFIDIIGDITEDTVDPVIDPIDTISDPIDTISDPIDTTQPSPVDTTQPSPVDTVTDTVTDVISDVIGGGDGTGTGEGTGAGDGTGTGTGADTGLGFGSATRTTDSLFGDMLQLQTQVGSTQERLRPFSMAPVPTTMQYDVPPVNPVQQFLQQQEAIRLRNKPQGMLTNAEILKRFPY